ncbi:MAG: hypothetical protein AAGA77_12610 [Bacteroidota bacterium]
MKIYQLKEGSFAVHKKKISQRGIISTLLALGLGFTISNVNQGLENYSDFISEL